MQIKYIRTKPYFNKVVGEEVWDNTACFIDFGMEQHPSKSIGDRFRSLQPEDRDSNLFVFRTNNVSAAKSIANDSILRTTLKDKSVFILGPLSKENGFEMCIQQVLGARNDDTEFNLTWFREIEMRCLLEQNDCLLYPTDAHFGLPNGLHADGFIHIAKAFRDPINIARMADWIMPYVTAETALLADTQNMTSLLLQAKCKALETFQWNLELSSLHEYPSEPNDLNDCVHDLKDRLQQNGRILFLLSVNSSGRTATRFKDICPPGSIVVALCDARKDETKAVDEIFVTIPIVRFQPNEHGDCEKCKSDLNLIYIDRETLELRPKAILDNRKPSIDKAESKKDFWEAASRSNAVRLHFNIRYGESEYSRSRHHPIYIDTERLSRDVVFRRICVEKLEKLPPPDLVIIPRHQNSDIIVNLLREVKQFSVPLDGSSPSIRISQLSELCDLLQNHKSAKRILIADDGLVTGLTVRNFKTQIYEFYQPSGNIPDLECFVMIARPHDLKAWRFAKLPFQDGDDKHMTCGEMVYLPSRDDKCPWCQERTMLNEYRGKLGGLSEEAAKVLQQRITHLEGEVESPLIVSNPSSFLTLKSFFGNLNSKAAFASMSSVTQTLTNEIGDKPNPFKITAIDLSFVVEAYFEAIFPAGLLRTLDKKYCRVAEHENSMTEFIENFLSFHSYPGLVAELAWAAVQDKLPSKPVLNLLEKVSKNDPVLEWMHQLLALTSQHGELS